jgi:hypothetical protein
MRATPTTRRRGTSQAVEWVTAPPLGVGTRTTFVARFLGRRLEYTYEVREHVPGERFVMSTSEGPFPMETTYAFEDAGEGATRMMLRNRGEPAGFAKATAPLMGAGDAARKPQGPGPPQGHPRVFEIGAGRRRHGLGGRPADPLGGAIVRSRAPSSAAAPPARHRPRAPARRRAR